MRNLQEALLAPVLIALLALNSMACACLPRAVDAVPDKPHYHDARGEAPACHDDCDGDCADFGAVKSGKRQLPIPAERLEPEFDSLVAQPPPPPDTVRRRGFSTDEPVTRRTIPPATPVSRFERMLD